MHLNQSEYVFITMNNNLRKMRTEVSFSMRNLLLKVLKKSGVKKKFTEHVNFFFSFGFTFGTLKIGHRVEAIVIW
ncbi:hypothetical protein ACTVDP_16860, partial [Anoxybacteroides rupiense]